MFQPSEVCPKEWMMMINTLDINTLCKWHVCGCYVIRLGVLTALCSPVLSTNHCKSRLPALVSLNTTLLFVVAMSVECVDLRRKSVCVCVFVCCLQSVCLINSGEESTLISLEH